MAFLRGFVEGLRAQQGGPTPESVRAWPSRLGNIRLIASRGVERTATYRGIYLTNPWVYGAVNKLSRDIARLPLHVFELSADARRRRVRGDVPSVSRGPGGESLDRILRRPDRTMSRFAFWNGTLVDRLVYGNALSVVEREGGIVSGLRRRRWRDVGQVEEGSDGDVLFYELRVGNLFGQPQRLVPGDVVHFGRGVDPEGPQGRSPLESCQYTIALYEGIVRYLVSFFENQAAPSGHISVENLTAEKAKLIRELLTEAYASPENAGKVLVTSGKWESVGIAPEHSQVVELVKLSRNEVATVYAVPPPILGIMENAIRSNVKELREQYVREGVGPWATEIEDDLAAQFISPVPAWRFLFAEFQLAEQLRPDLEARSQVFQRMKHMMSIDEQRGIENLPPLDIAGVSDVPWVDSGALPISAFAAGGLAKEIAAEVARALSGSPNGDRQSKVRAEVIE